MPRASQVPARDWRRLQEVPRALVDRLRVVRSWTARVRGHGHTQREGRQRARRTPPLSGNRGHPRGAKIIALHASRPGLEMRPSPGGDARASR
eukprot:8162653-Pyramimonas_sp.AAC.1